MAQTDDPQRPLRSECWRSRNSGPGKRRAIRNAFCSTICDERPQNFLGMRAPIHEPRLCFDDRGAAARGWFPPRPGPPKATDAQVRHARGYDLQACPVCRRIRGLDRSKSGLVRPWKNRAGSPSTTSHALAGFRTQRCRWCCVAVRCWMPTCGSGSRRKYCARATSTTVVRPLTTLHADPPARGRQAAELLLQGAAAPSLLRRSVSARAADRTREHPYAPNA